MTNQQIKQDTIKQETIILGVDPGTLITGFGLLLLSGSQTQVLDYGRIVPPPKKGLTERIAIIQQSIEEIIRQWSPKALSIELQYFPRHYNNPSSVLKIGMARGVICVAAQRMGISEIYEYTPSQAKRAVTGNGRANKTQMCAMIKHLLNLKQIPQEDAADALSLALCHAHSLASKQALGQRI